MSLDIKLAKHIKFITDVHIKPSDTNFTLVQTLNQGRTQQHIVWYDRKYVDDAFYFYFTNLDKIIQTNLRDYYDL